jgi:hypothetical protein
MNGLQRFIASALLAGCMVGAIALPHPLSHGHYLVAAAVVLLVVAGALLFKRLRSRRIGFSTGGAVIGALVGLLIAGNALLRTAIGAPGQPRSSATEAALLLLITFCGAIAAFFASYVAVGIKLTATRPHNESNRDA